MDSQAEGGAKVGLEPRASASPRTSMRGRVSAPRASVRVVEIDALRLTGLATRRTKDDACRRNRSYWPASGTAGYLITFCLG